MLWFEKTGGRIKKNKKKGKRNKIVFFERQALL